MGSTAYLSISRVLVSVVLFAYPQGKKPFPEEITLVLAN